MDSGPQLVLSNGLHRHRLITIVSTLFICLHTSDILHRLSREENSYTLVEASNIDFGSSNLPSANMSTDYLMPKLCQNQSVICEGSFCIPGVKKCVCDLRRPVQFGRFCLRQVDVGTKCFVTSQCNHTIKDASCIDQNSNSILDQESSKFKLEQWQQLNELRQLSANSKDISKQTSKLIAQKTASTRSGNRYPFNDYRRTSINVEAREDTIVVNGRNSPYEINYDTRELLDQNHTRRAKNHGDRASIFTGPSASQQVKEAPSKSTPSSITTTQTTSSSESSTSLPQNEPVNSPRTSSPMLDIATTGKFSTEDLIITSQAEGVNTPTTSPSSSDSAGRKKVTIKATNWPPGVCACPFGFMFDPMVRRCLALSLTDSHCLSDFDCKQIPMTHCSVVTRKCQCDEPLEWDQKELACLRLKPTTTTENPLFKPRNNPNLVQNLLPTMVFTKMLPDYTVLLVIFIFVIIVGTLIILRLTVKCFSSSSSALISPKSKKKKSGNLSNLPPRSPYATLRRPDHKPSSQLSNFTQVTRGRILNYDFENDDSIQGNVMYTSGTSTTPRQPRQSKAQDNNTATMRVNRGHKHPTLAETTANKKLKANESMENQTIELNDNISLSQLESESKSETNSNSVINIPPPPPNQQPPYMLASTMKGQGSAIAAAAAAVANKRKQMAQKKNLEQQAAGNVVNGSPVFL